MKNQNSRILLFAVALAMLAMVVPQANAAAFVPASSMHYARSSHTATLLPNGKVLVAGGWGAGTSAELYNPTTDTWTVTGSLRVARAGADATLLPNGKVLVAGGGQSGGSFVATAAAELYNPATGTWTLISPMKHARIDTATGTLLPDGKVLEVDATSELYDPASGTWTDTGSPSTARLTAALLPNGKVLAAGFVSGPAELYDPVTGMWTITGTPSTNYYTATLLLNGKVLAAGGSHISTAELYDPQNGTWSATGSLAWEHNLCTATLLRNGQVLIATGYDGGASTTIPSAELYDPATETWTEIPMNAGRLWHTATLLPNGKVLVAGGQFRPGNSISSAELFEPDSDGALSSLTVLHQADQVLSFSWNGVGTLEQSDSLTAPNWQPAPIQNDPHTVSTTDPMKFFRVKSE